MPAIFVVLVLRGVLLVVFDWEGFGWYVCSKSLMFVRVCVAVVSKGGFRKKEEEGKRKITG